MKSSPLDLLDDAKRIAKLAGDAIMEIYNKGDFELYQKVDDSPVTSADYAANEILIRELTALSPHIPIISEEMEVCDLAERRSWSTYWLLDPMDGTQEFVSRSGDFAVNIALIANHEPVLGVIYWPTQNTWYFATQGNGAFKQTADNKTAQSISVKAHQDESSLRLAVSRVQKADSVSAHLYHPEKFKRIALGSCSLKNCLIAEGNADFYLRIGPTGEWDTGASHCILKEAGGDILDAEFQPITYNRRDTLANPDFIVMGDQSTQWTNIVRPHKTLRKLN